MEENNYNPLETTRIQKKISESLEKIANTYVKENNQKPFFKTKYFWSFVLAFIALLGYWMNWKAEITSIQINRIEKQKILKQELQRDINYLIMKARAVILTQIKLCDIRDKKPAELEVERINEALLGLIALGTGSRYVYSTELQKSINKLTASIDQIQDVCKLDAEKTDEKHRKLFREITEGIEKSIQEENEALIRLENQGIFDFLRRLFDKYLF